jgi:CheY-like chemotaxis protein
VRRESRLRQRIEADRQRLLDLEQAARARAETANRAKDELLALVSHELRTPLTPILAITELLQRDSSLNREAAELLERVRENVLVESRIVSDLLESTRLASGKLELMLEDVDVHALLRRSIDQLRTAAADKQLAVQVSLCSDNPQVRADRVRLEQVFQNLISNAIKFNTMGGSLTVQSECIGQKRDRLLIHIRDTGIGIDPGVLSRLFEPFGQADRSMTRRFGGMGLGLYLARSIVQLHAGTLTAKSEGPGAGSTFTIELPCVQSPASPKMPSAAPAKTMRVLLVEDNPDTLSLLGKVLTRLSCDVVPAANATEALAAAEQNHIDLVISDIGLPDRSGWELMQELRTRGLRGVAISGFSSEEDRQRSHESGFSRHLVKPVGVQELKTILQEFAPVA